MQSTNDSTFWASLPIPLWFIYHWQKSKKTKPELQFMRPSYMVTNERKESAKSISVFNCVTAQNYLPWACVAQTKEKTVLHHSWPEHLLWDMWKMAEQYSSTTCCGKFLLGSTVIHLYKKIKHTLSIFLFTVFLPHSLLSCSLIACNSLPKWIILSMAAWLPPHSWRLNWLESTSKETISSSSPLAEPRVTAYGSTDSALISLKHGCLPRESRSDTDPGPTCSCTTHWGTAS